ncbi:hypothetical protein GOODEAATRI_009641 [Goodea atripinnis]|uniref:Uncharacterized protein n=1 Tax=Goodea atripinnis TaxID=208336 RepID=A0ABV0NJV9_9TELE
MTFPALEWTGESAIPNEVMGKVLSFLKAKDVSYTAIYTGLQPSQVHQTGQTGSFIGSRGIYAPAEYSFRCQSVSSFRDALLIPSNQNTTQWRLNFIDFQIQGFGLSNSTNFSYASDCAGFFTAGIWMGLITSLLMLLIFVYGLHMIMQLNTMDRFDDPKGPSISVPQSE